MLRPRALRTACRHEVLLTLCRSTCQREDEPPCSRSWWWYAGRSFLLDPKVRGQHATQRHRGSARLEDLSFQVAIQSLDSSPYNRRGALDRMKQYCSTAVIVHWGDPSPTIEVALRYHQEGDFSKVVVVANDLQDCPGALQGSAISWIIPPRNLGFGGACNFGAQRYVASKYAFLNADVTLSSNVISMCLDALDISGVGISGPMLHFPSGELQSACGSVSRYMKIARSNTPPAQSISECDWVTGAALFCRHEVFDSIGFDGSYFLGVEDVDIGYRAKLQGWKVVVVSGEVATHQARTTLKGARPVYYVMRNQIWFSRRHGSFLGGSAITLYLLRALPRIMLADVVKRRPSHVLLMYHGLIAGWRTLPNAGEPLVDEPIPSRWIDWQRNCRVRRGWTGRPDPSRNQLSSDG
jgi:GT2 family glycosyltransferase